VNGSIFDKEFFESNSSARASERDTLIYRTTALRFWKWTASKSKPKKRILFAEITQPFFINIKIETVVHSAVKIRTTKIDDPVITKMTSTRIFAAKYVHASVHLQNRLS